MKRVLLDENLDWRVRALFNPEFEVETVAERGWGGLDNGDLLRRAEVVFDVLVTLDKNLRYQQHLEGFDIAVVLVRVRSNRRAMIEPLMPQINTAVAKSEPGAIAIVTA